MPLLQFVIGVFFLSLTLFKDVEGCQMTNQLLWAPGLRKKVFTTFLNDLSCPTWMTRSSFTKETTGRTHRRVPFGTPFAFLCGACFSSFSGFKVNLTLISNGVEVEFAPLKSRTGKELHRGWGGDDCLVSYGVTAPITGSGSLTCRLNRGKTHYDENIQFRGVHVPIKESEMLTVLAKDDVEDLVCPKIENPTGDIFYVWHAPLETKEPKIIIASMRPNISMPISSSDMEVMCSAYDSNNPKEVRRQSFWIQGRQVEDADHEKKEWVVGTGKYQDESQNHFSFALIAIIVGSVIGGVILLAWLLVVVRS